MKILLFVFLILIKCSLVASESVNEKNFFLVGDRTHKVWEYCFVRCGNNLYMQQAQWPGYGSREFFRLQIDNKTLQLLTEITGTKSDAEPPFPPESAKVWRVLAFDSKSNVTQFYTRKSKIIPLVTQLRKEMARSGKKHDGVPECIKNDKSVAKVFGFAPAASQ